MHVQDWESTAWEPLEPSLLLKVFRQFLRSAGIHIYTKNFRANILLECDSLRLAAD